MKKRTLKSLTKTQTGKLNTWLKSYNRLTKLYNKGNRLTKSELKFIDNTSQIFLLPGKEERKAVKNGKNIY